MTALRQLSDEEIITVAAQLASGSQSVAIFYKIRKDLHDERDKQRAEAGVNNAKVLNALYPE